MSLIVIPAGVIGVASLVILAISVHDISILPFGVVDHLLVKLNLLRSVVELNIALSVLILSAMLGVLIAST